MSQENHDHESHDHENHDCRRCPLYRECSDLCEPVAAMVARVEHHFRGAEILAGPRAMTFLAAGQKRPALADIAREPVTERDLAKIPGLTARQRTTLSLKLVEGASTREIARRLGVSQTTVMEHLTVARRKAGAWLRLTLPAKIAARTHIGRSV